MVKTVQQIKYGWAGALFGFSLGRRGGCLGYRPYCMGVWWEGVGANQSHYRADQACLGGTSLHKGRAGSFVYTKIQRHSTHLGVIG